MYRILYRIFRRSNRGTGYRKIREKREREGRRARDARDEKMEGPGMGQ